MSSMLARSLKSGFKPKVARRNAPSTSASASVPPSSESVSKTPAPTSSQAPTAPSASPVPAANATPSSDANSAPEPAPSTSASPSRPSRPPQVAGSARRAQNDPSASTSPRLSRKGPASEAQNKQADAIGREEENTVPGAVKDTAVTGSTEPTIGAEQSVAARQPPTEAPTAVPEPPTSSTTTRSKVPSSPRTRGGPAKPASLPSPARPRTRTSRGVSAQETETGPVPASQSDNAANDEAQVVDPTPAASTGSGVTEQTEAPKEATPGGRRRKADATPNTDNGEGSSSHGNNAAEPQTAAPRKRVTKRAAALPGEEGYHTAAERRAASGAPKRIRKRKSPTDGEETPAADTADDSGSARPGKKRAPPRHQRETTPENSENVEIDITQVKMADLVKDMRTGKKFSLHDELMERERMKRQKYSGKKNGEAAPANGDSATPNLEPSGSGSASASTPAEPVARTGPAAGETYRIVDGVIVVDSGSLQVDRHARAAEEAGEMEEHEENEFTHHTTSATYLRRNMKPRQWADEETEKFYWALSMFGTDFETIAKMFPGKTRKHVKLKFNREERSAPARIQAALVGQKTVGMDMDEYKRHTGAEYETAEEIYAQQKKAEEEFEARQKALQEAKEEEARKRREELFGSNKEGDKDQEEAGKKKKGRGKKAKRTEATW